MRRIVFGAWLVLGMGLLSAGCSDQYSGRYAISGKVTLEGKPLDEGQILFFPIENQDTTTGVGIANGRYEIPRQNGLKPGKYLVRITSGDLKTPEVTDEEAASPGGSTNVMATDRIPPEWNISSDKQVEVKESGGNEFNFDIPKAIDTKKAADAKKKKKK
jgi:hypothetical protein